MATPFFSAYDTISTPNGTWIKPGGQVVAYVRSTGAQSGDLPEVVVNMVATIASGVARCRAGMNDVVIVLPGHTETLTSSTNLFTPVAGAQIIGVANPMAGNAPNVTLSATAASLVLSAANMTIAGLSINSATAAVVAAINVTASGVTLANNFISFTGALAANNGITFATVSNFSFLNNYYQANCTGTMLIATGACPNVTITGNFFRQIQATNGGSYVDLGATALTSGLVGFNVAKTARSLTGQGTGFDLDGANVIVNVLNVENYCTDADVATAAILATGAAAG